MTVEDPEHETSQPAVLLVGGSSQIGLAIADEVTRGQQARIILAGRPTPALDEAADRLRARGHSVSCLAYDAQWSAPRTEAMLRCAADLAPRLDLVVVAVGALVTRQDNGEIAEPAMERLLTTNLVGPALVANAAVDVLAGQGHGHLVVVTSAAAARPRGQILGYSVAKQALDSFVVGLDRRTRPYGVRCHVVRPGQVRTRMTAGRSDVPFTTGPERVAQRVRRALSGRAAVVWSPPALRPLTALLRLAPGWALPEELR